MDLGEQVAALFGAEVTLYEVLGVSKDATAAQIKVRPCSRFPPLRVSPSLAESVPATQS